MDYAFFVPLMLAVGVFSGFIAGIFGIGGGFVVVPALYAALHLLGGSVADENQIMHVAIGTSLATIVFTSLRSLNAHAKHGAVDWRILRQWLPWVALGSLLGVMAADAMNGEALKKLFGLSVIAMGLAYAFPRQARASAGTEKIPDGLLRIGLGATLGGSCSLLGIGGGAPAVMILTSHGVGMHRAVATAAGFGALVALPASIVNVLTGFGEPGLPLGSVGYVNLIALAAITATSLVAVPLGAATAHRLNAAKLKRNFGFCMIATGIIMFSL